MSSGSFNFDYEKINMHDNKAVLANLGGNQSFDSSGY